MKMQPKHYAELRAAFAAVSDKIKESAPQYRAASLTEKRLAWDAARCGFRAMGLQFDRWICDDLYPYLNDAHIDTAVMKALRETLAA